MYDIQKSLRASLTLRYASVKRQKIAVINRRSVIHTSAPFNPRNQALRDLYENYWAQVTLFVLNRIPRSAAPRTIHGAQTVRLAQLHPHSQFRRPLHPNCTVHTELYSTIYELLIPFRRCSGMQTILITNARLASSTPLSSYSRSRTAGAVLAECGVRASTRSTLRMHFDGEQID